MMTMSAAFGSIHEYQIDQPSLCSPASLSRSTNHKGHKANPIISVDRSLHISSLCRLAALPWAAFGSPNWISAPLRFIDGESDDVALEWLLIH